MLYTPNPERLVRVYVHADTERLHQRIAELEQELEAQCALVQMYRHVALALSKALSTCTRARLQAGPPASRWAGADNATKRAA